MRCKEIRELIMTDYLDGELKGKTLEEVRLHIEGCAECRAIEIRLKGLGASLKKAVPAEPRGEVWERIRADLTSGKAYRPGIFAEAREGLRAFLLGPRFVFARTAAVAAVVVIMLVSSMWLRGSTTISGEDAFITYLSNGTADAGQDFGTSIEEYFL
ncbi:MAG: anti-sigma factor [Candidatus Omnitrophota bacterium]